MGHRNPINVRLPAISWKMDWNWKPFFTFCQFFYHIWWFFKFPQYTNTCIEKSSNVTKILLSIEKGMSVKFAFNLFLFNRGNQNLRVGLANISVSNSKWTKDKGWLEIVLSMYLWLAWNRQYIALRIIHQNNLRNRVCHLWKWIFAQPKIFDNVYK